MTCSAPNGLGSNSRSSLEELGVVVAAAEVVESERLLRGDDDERLAQAGAGVVVGAEDRDVREGQLRRLDPGAEEPAVAPGLGQVLLLDPFLGRLRGDLLLVDLGPAFSAAVASDS